MPVKAKKTIEMKICIHLSFSGVKNREMGKIAVPFNFETKTASLSQDSRFAGKLKL